MDAELLTLAFRIPFWFARKKYYIVRSDFDAAADAELVEPAREFRYRCISLENPNGHKEFTRVDAALSGFLPYALRITIRKAMHAGGTLITATVPDNGQIAACWVIYSATAERNILALRSDELYVGNSYVQPAYRGLGLQALTLQQGLRHLRVRNKGKHWVIAIVRPDNESSLRGLAKVGFRVEGTLVEQRIFRFVRLISGLDTRERSARLVFGNPL